MYLVTALEIEAEFTGHLPLNSEFKATYDSVSKKKKTKLKKEAGVTLMFRGG